MTNSQRKIYNKQLASQHIKSNAGNLKKSNLKRSSSISSVEDKSGLLARILYLCVGLLLLVGLMRISLGKFQVPSFTELLRVISNVPTVEIPFVGIIFNTVEIESSFFQFLANFANGIGKVLDVGIFMVNGLISVITYVIYFFKWFFVL